ncbi:hypothetical protein [Pseudoalteromonas spongiae]|uniref:hypothetical protein n=1 Tax=Pseudoalteromonas spongiae TaxID=298657 RepID=UPI00026C9F2F|nr:hypothetical protein [Pseudoalteromonas spongiae]ATC99605.1 hypothetical protein PSPO_a2698 [Pseudoalteromonas spongiae UST010723-006]
MIRLGRTGWNNVIIFAMLIMIFLFNGLHHKIISSSDDETTQSLLPPNSAVLTYQYSDFKIERIGTSWRTNKQLNIDVELFDVNWRQASGEIIPITNEQASSLASVELYIAGYDRSLVFDVFATLDGCFVDDNQARRIKLDKQTCSQLFPTTEF